MQIKEEEYARFQNEGFLILKDHDIRHQISSLSAAITENGKFFFDHDFALGASLKAIHEGRIGDYYKSLGYLPELFRFAAAPSLISLMNSLGLLRPCMMNANNVRFDTPDNRALFHWHQDTTYLLGSTNAITIWIPLTQADRFHGSIELIPRSHKNGIQPFAFSKGTPATKAPVSPKDLHLVEEPLGNRITVEADPGDLVIFSQMLLHRSTPNFADHPRVTVQLRYSDLGDSTFRDAGYPFGDQTNIAYVEKYLTMVRKI